MKLAEALMLRADYQRNIAKIKERLIENSTTQEGEKPSENPELLLSEFNDMANALENLIVKINKTNSSVIIKDNATFTDLLAQRDILKLKLQVLNDLAKSASAKQDRYSHSEIKTFSTVNVPEIRKEINSMSKQYRELDIMIQEHNWKINVLE